MAENVCGKTIAADRKPIKPREPGHRLNQRGVSNDPEVTRRTGIFQLKVTKRHSNERSSILFVFRVLNVIL